MSILTILYEKKYKDGSISKFTRVGVINSWTDPEMMERMERDELMHKLNDELHNYRWEKHSFLDVMKRFKDVSRDEMLLIWEEWKDKTPEQIYNFLFCYQIELFEGVAQ